MKRHLIIIISSILLLVGCGVLERYNDKGDVMTSGFVDAKQMMMPEAAPAPAIPDRKIIHTVRLVIEVKDVKRSSDEILKLIKDSGGFVADSRSYEDDAGRKRIFLILRVPSDRLDKAVGGVKGVGRVREENITGEDVTESYFDVEARLANAKRLEERILKLLDQQSKSLKDVLDVEKELADVREKIESLEGRKRFMDDRLNLATIDVELMEPPGFGRGIFDPLSGSLHRALSTFTESIALLIVVISGAAPWIAILVLFAWLFLHFLRFWVRKRREAREKKKKVQDQK